MQDVPYALGSLGLTHLSVRSTLSIVVPILDRRDRIVNCSSGGAGESLYYITVLSNLVRGYDKYARIYDKSNILESTYPNRFFLLSKHEIGVGIAKASRLLHKTGLLAISLSRLRHTPALRNFIRIRDLGEGDSLSGVTSR